MPDMNIAVIGCGYWGKNLVRNFYELDSLYTICDIDEKTVESLTNNYPGLSVGYTDYRSLLKDSNVKAVAISTPASNHYETAKQALLADKDIFVEKPIAMRCREGEELVKLAKERNRILMVGHILAYHPAIRELRRLVDAGELGKINYVYSNRLNLGKLRTEESVFLSFAPHDISAIIDLLGDEPVRVSSHNGSYISRGISDTTIMVMEFSGGTKAHIFVSWLHPYKEQKLVVVGTKAMAVFDDVAEEKLVLYPHEIKWEDGRLPVAMKAKNIAIPVDDAEPLRLECEHFISCVRSRTRPKTDGESGLKVLRVLEACREDRSVHKSSFIDDGVTIGKGTRVWHFSHILKNTKVGEDCNIGQNVCIGPNVTIGNNVKIQNNVSVYEGVTLEDDVFCGPSAVFTNVRTPRSHYPRRGKYAKTLVEKGATIGANATIICGMKIGAYALIGAGAVVTKDVPSHALVYGVPATQRGWVCYCAAVLRFGVRKKETDCPVCKRAYVIEKEGLRLKT